MELLMPRHQGIWNQNWAQCSRCGFDYPISQLTKQKGLMLDAKCLDNLDVEIRIKTIAEILSDGEEINNELAYMADNQDELIF